MHGGAPVACVNVASEGWAAGRPACPQSIAPTLTAEEKQKALRTRIELSVFAVLKPARTARGCKDGEAKGEAEACE